MATDIKSPALGVLALPLGKDSLFHFLIDILSAYHSIFLRHPLVNVEQGFLGGLIPTSYTKLRLQISAARLLLKWSKCIKCFCISESLPYYHCSDVFFAKFSYAPPSFLSYAEYWICCDSAIESRWQLERYINRIKR